MVMVLGFWSKTARLMDEVLSFKVGSTFNRFLDEKPVAQQVNI